MIDRETAAQDRVAVAFEGLADDVEAVRAAFPDRIGLADLPCRRPSRRTGRPAAAASRPGKPPGRASGRNRRCRDGTGGAAGVEAGTGPRLPSHDSPRRRGGEAGTRRPQRRTAGGTTEPSRPPQENRKCTSVPSCPRPRKRCGASCAGPANPAAAAGHLPQGGRPLPFPEAGIAQDRTAPSTGPSPAPALPRPLDLLPPSTCRGHGACPLALDLRLCPPVHHPPPPLAHRRGGRGWGGMGTARYSSKSRDFSGCHPCDARNLVKTAAELAFALGGGVTGEAGPTR